MARRLQDYELVRRLVDVQNQRIANLEKENELLKRENELKDRIIEIDQREIDATRRALNDMKEVADRAVKLAEVSKPKSNWQLGGLLTGLAILAGYLIAK